MSLTMNDLDVKMKLFKLKANADIAVDNYFGESAAMLQAYAKQNAPWRDRTGNARRTLKGTSFGFHFGKKCVSIVGRMYYSPDLELSYGGRYSILFPTILNNYKSILQGTVKAVEEVRL